MATAPPSNYDSNLCFMNWQDSDYLWIQSRSYCEISPPGTDAYACHWNLGQGLGNTRTPLPIPKGYPSTILYTCDNQLHNLGWSETDLIQNRYICDCGRALAQTANCTGRCDIPWTSSFEKKCNVVTNSVKKGNFSSYGGTQGTCLSAAGYRPINLANSNPVDVPIANLKGNELLVIDGFGLTQACSSDNLDRGNGRMCNCDGALPETFMGQKVVYRDACGLEKEGDKAWIAGPVVGGVALLSLILVGLYLLNKRRKKNSRLNKRRTSLQPLVDDIALAEMGNRSAAGRQRRDVNSYGTTAPPSGEVQSVFSTKSHESYDSGVSMMPAAAQAEGSRRTEASTSTNTEQR